ncbi:MAG: hypothetical protein WC346_02160 [Methanogenium sp.]|jgi:hypothetical protein
MSAPFRKDTDDGLKFGGSKRSFVIDPTSKSIVGNSGQGSATSISAKMQKSTPFTNTQKQGPSMTKHGSNNGHGNKPFGHKKHKSHESDDDDSIMGTAKDVVKLGVTVAGTGLLFGAMGKLFDKD